MNASYGTVQDRTAGAGDDATLLLRVSRGDREAMRQLYCAYFRRLTRFLSRTIRDPQLVEEVVNDTMLVVWQHAGEFRGASRPSTWILGIAYRRALKALARETSSRRRTMPLQSGDAAGPAIDGLVEQAERDEWLGAGLERLSAEHRLALELTYFMGLSCEEVAEVVGCPVGTVKTRVFYARQQLRAVLLELSTPRREEGP